MTSAHNFDTQAKRLIDDLKSVCANYGLGNDGNEFKIITQIFLYKFLNDKFAYEAKRIDPALAEVGRTPDERPPEGSRIRMSAPLGAEQATTTGDESVDEHKAGSSYLSEIFRRVMDHRMRNTSKIKLSPENQKNSALNFAMCANHLKTEDHEEVLNFVINNYEGAASNIELYQRMVRNILEFIDQECPKGAAPHKYSKILFGQMENGEMLLLALSVQIQRAGELPKLLERFELKSAIGKGSLESMPWHRNASS